jgi:internalin A
VKSRRPGHLQRTATAAFLLAGLAASKSAAQEHPLRDRFVADAVAFLENRGCAVGFENAKDLGSACKLDLSGSSLMAGELRRINEIPHLDSLTILNTRLTEKGLSAIDDEKWANVRELKLSDIAVGPRLLATLSKMRSIEVLILARAQLSDESLDAMKNLETITWLNLEKNEVTDRGVARLFGLKDISALFLSGTRVGDATLVAAVASLKDLQILDLADTKVSDEGLRSMSDHPEVHDLNIANTRVTDKSSVFLRKLPKLDTLVLTNTAIGDDCLSEVGKKSAMLRLYIGGTKVTGRGLEQIKPLTNLRVLNLSSTKIGNADLESLTKMTRLENLVLDDTSVTDGCLQHLLDLPELREVTFANTLVTPFGFKQFQLEWQRRRNAAGKATNKRVS